MSLNGNHVLTTLRDQITEVSPDESDGVWRKIEAIAPMYPDALIGHVVFGCTPAEFEQIKARDPRVTEAITNGRTAAQMEWSKALLQQARAGNVDAIRYLEQTRYGVSA